MTNVFPIPVSGIQCEGLGDVLSPPPGIRTAEECAEYCCGEYSCMLWQFAPQRGCWLGTKQPKAYGCDNAPLDPVNPYWVGGARPPPPTSSPTPGPTFARCSAGALQVDFPLQFPGPMGAARHCKGLNPMPTVNGQPITTAEECAHECCVRLG